MSHIFAKLTDVGNLLYYLIFVDLVLSWHCGKSLFVFVDRSKEMHKQLVGRL